MSSTSPDTLHSGLFTGLVMSLMESALIGLGKVIHPAKGKAEVDLEAAQHAIDLLDMLEAKTKGNLTAEEERMLKQTVSMLKINYVETLSAHQTGSSAGAEAQPQRSTNETPPAEDKVRFRKKYD